MVIFVQVFVGTMLRFGCERADLRLVYKGVDYDKI